MAAPNIVNVTTITGKTVGANVSSSLTSLVLNSSGSGDVYKINSLLISNIDGENNAEVDITFYDNQSVDYYVAKTIVVPADATLDVLSKSLYLEENDSIRVKASANSDLQAVCSFEIITDD